MTLFSAACRPQDEQPTKPQPTSSLRVFQDRVQPGSMKGWNLLFMSMDTTRADHLGCYGYAPAETPRIDELASRGVLFEHAVAPTSSTLPSHTTMMTGLGLMRHGVHTNGYFTLGDEAVTLAEILQQQGYATAAVTCTGVLGRRFGLAQGFDLYDDISQKAGRPAIPRHAVDVTDKTIAWLTDLWKTSPGKPFFFWTHYFDPHEPYAPPDKAYFERFADAPYDGEIAYTDAHIGRLLDFLAAHREADKTLIVLTADHGEGLGEHSEDTHSRLVYDTTVHVPLIFSAAQFHDHAGRVDDVTVGLIDIMPTILSLFGVEPPLTMDGVDLVTSTISPDRAIYIETLAPLVYHGWASLHGLRTIDAKYVEAPIPEYFRLDDDPAELENLLDSDPNAGASLAAQLGTYLSQFPPAEVLASRARPLNKTQVAMLSALGYVSTTNPGLADLSKRPDPKDMVPLFKVLHDKPKALLKLAWEIVENPDAAPAANRRALILAQTARFRAPEDPACAMGAGAAHYRVGDYAEAAEALSEAKSSLSDGDGSTLARVMAFRTMALFRLGREDQARAELKRLRAIVAQLNEPVDDKLQAFVAEAEGVVEYPGD